MAINLVTVLKTIINKIVKIDNNTLDRSTYEKVFCTAQIPDYTITTNDLWTIEDHSAFICGNNLRIYGKCTRSTATTSGDIPNETIMTFNIPDERIISIDSINSRNYDVGTVCSIFLNGYSDDEGNKVKVELTHTHAATKALSFIQNIPINIDIEKY